MSKIILAVVSNDLAAIYQPFWFSLVLAILIMFFYLHATDVTESGKGWKKSVQYWLKSFYTFVKFRKLFLLALFISMIVFRTLFNRDMRFNPLGNVWGHGGFMFETE